VIAGTAASIAGNVAHDQPSLVAQGIAAAIPLAVLAMLEGPKGDAGDELPGEGASAAIVEPSRRPGSQVPGGCLPLKREARLFAT
jgi:hypothetical protein